MLNQLGESRVNDRVRVSVELVIQVLYKRLRPHLNVHTHRLPFEELSQ